MEMTRSLGLPVPFESVIPSNARFRAFQFFRERRVRVVKKIFILHDMKVKLAIGDVKFAAGQGHNGRNAWGG